MHISPLKTKAKPNCTLPFLLPLTAPPWHGDASAVLRVSISVSNLALKWGERICMGEVLYSTKWVKYSAQQQATTQNTTTTHNNQHELPLPYPSAALALSLHENILHGPIRSSTMSLTTLILCQIVLKYMF
jgi:hypothetical protein